jgi:hypothetical protein
MREGIDPEDCITDKSNKHDLWDQLEQQHIVTALPLTLESPDVSFDFRYALILGSEIL